MRSSFQKSRIIEIIKMYSQLFENSKSKIDIQSFLAQGGRIEPVY